MIKNAEYTAIKKVDRKTEWNRISCNRIYRMKTVREERLTNVFVTNTVINFMDPLFDSESSRQNSCDVKKIKPTGNCGLKCAYYRRV